MANIMSSCPECGDNCYGHFTLAKFFAEYGSEPYPYCSNALARDSMSKAAKHVQRRTDEARHRNG